MKIRIELVGFLAREGLPNEFTGGELSVPVGTTLGQALTQIGVAPNAPWLATVNRRLVEREQRLNDGDVVKLIPPISGG